MHREISWRGDGSFRLHITFLGKDEFCGIREIGIGISAGPRQRAHLALAGPARAKARFAANPGRASFDRPPKSNPIRCGPRHRSSKRDRRSRSIDSRPHPLRQPFIFGATSARSLPQPIRSPLASPNPPPLPLALRLSPSPRQQPFPSPHLPHDSRARAIPIPLPLPTSAATPGRHRQARQAE